MRRYLLLGALAVGPAGCAQQDADEGGGPDATFRELRDAAMLPMSDAALLVPDAAMVLAADAAGEDAADGEVADLLPDAGPEDEPDAAPVEPMGPCGAHPVVDLNAAIAADGYYEGTTEGAAGGFVGTCGGAAGGEVVLAYTVDEVGAAITFATDFPETTAPTVVYVRGECGDFQDLACNRGSTEAPGTRARFEPPAPGTYYVVVDTGSRDGGGPFRLAVEEMALPACRDLRDNDNDGLIDLFDPGCVDDEDDSEADPPTPPQCADGIDNDNDGVIDYPDDDDCTAAGDDMESGVFCAQKPNVQVVGPAGGQVQVNTAQAGDAYSGSCGGRGPEQVVALITDRVANLTFRIVQADFDTLIWVRFNDCDMGREVGCNDDFNGLNSQVSVAGAQPGIYYLFLDAFGAAGGNVTVEVTVQ